MVQENKKEISQEDINKAKEIVIPITLAGLGKGLNKIFITAPKKLFEKTAKKVNDFSYKLVKKHSSATAMPIGIMLRNGSAVAYDAMKGKSRYSILSGVGAFASAVTAWWMVANAAFTAVGSSLLIGKVGTAIAVGVLTVPVALPAFTAGAVIGSLALGLAATALSIVPAVANIPTAIQRKKLYKQGHRLTEAELKVELKDNRFLEDDFQKGYMRSAEGIIHSLDDDNLKKLSERLNQEFNDRSTRNTVDPNQTDLQPKTHNAVVAKKNR